jgi:hypothetical protein
MIAIEKNAPYTPQLAAVEFSLHGVSIIKSISILFFACSWLISTSPLFAAAPSYHPLTLTSGSNILSLSFRTQNTHPTNNPYAVGHFIVDDEEYTPTFMGTDYRGRIFVMDPSTYSCEVLKSFTSTGHFDQAWEPLRMRGADPSACGSTQDGYVWVGLNGNTQQFHGLPVIIYKLGQHSPIADWRDELPVAVDKAIHQALSSRGMVWKRNWEVTSVEVGGRYVSLLLTGQAVGQQGYVARSLWLLVSANGITVYKAQVLDPDRLPLLTPEGQLLTWCSDLRNSPDFFWSKVWLEQPQDRKISTLINLLRNKEPFAPYLHLGADVLPPLVQIGSAGRIYLTFSRQALASQTKTNGLERAIVIMNGEGKLVAFLPWTSNCNSSVSWIKIRPGNGRLLRIKFSSQAAKIFSYPIP